MKTKALLKKIIKTIEAKSRLRENNPNHDERGRFAVGSTISVDGVKHVVADDYDVKDKYPNLAKYEKRHVMATSPKGKTKMLTQYHNGQWSSMTATSNPLAHSIKRIGKVEPA